ncbi:hypothetical protein ACIQWA_24925 [Kitasatospora sp. NPDC098652]
MLGLLIVNLLAALLGALCETRSTGFWRRPTDVRPPLTGARPQ